MTTDLAPTTQQNLVNRIRSRQAGHPSGLVGRIIGRAMVKDTADGNDRALELLGLTDQQIVLEVGFGQGRTAAKLIEQGHRILGTEVSKTMVKQATARNRRACRDGRAKLVLSKDGIVPFSDAAADAAFTTHTIYFMSDPQATLDEVGRVLRPGGRFVIACRVADDDIPAWMDLTVYRIPSKERVETMLGRAGFENITHQPGDASNHWTHLFAAELSEGGADRR